MAQREVKLRTELGMSALTGDCVALMRLEMLERGFTLVDTPPFADEELFLRLKRSRTSLPFHSKRWWQFPQLARYACWLEGLLGNALPEETVSLVALEFRHEPAGTADLEVDRLHADGGYIRSVLTLYGLPTLYREDGAEQPVPDGHTLLMTAQDRTRARRVHSTLHRRPGPDAERAVIVGTFEPRQEHKKLANVYRQAAQTAARKAPVSFS